MIQASTLVVAWYIRDRISRRRRKEKRHFRAGLQEKCSRTKKVSREEVVRQWVMAVPDVTLSPKDPITDQMRDQEEAEFNVDKETAPDKDARLFEMADNLIKSQSRKVEVPMFGVLDFSESDSEGEADEGASVEVGDGEDGGDEGDTGDYEELDDDDDLCDELSEEELGSELVHDGTGHGSRRDGTTLSS
jgi:hypothetical protein